MINGKVELTDAIHSLVPGAQVCIIGDQIEWINPASPPVHKEIIDAEIVRLQAEYDAKEYQRQRAPEYPSIQIGRAHV